MPPTINKHSSILKNNLNIVGVTSDYTKNFKKKGLTTKPFFVYGYYPSTLQQRGSLSYADFTASLSFALYPAFDIAVSIWVKDTFSES